MMEQKGLCKEERKIIARINIYYYQCCIFVTHKIHPHKDTKFYTSVIMDAHDFLLANTVNPNLAPPI
jgi:hypothetical protein